MSPRASTSPSRFNILTPLVQKRFLLKLRVTNDYNRSFIFLSERFSEKRYGIGFSDIYYSSNQEQCLNHSREMLRHSLVVMFILLPFFFLPRLNIPSTP